MTMGCGLSVTRNVYFYYPEQHEQASKPNSDQQPLLVDTLNMTSNGQH